MTASSLASGQSISRVVVRLLNERITATGATLPDLSRTTGIPAATLRRELAGHTDLGVATLHFLAAALGTTGADLCRTAQTEVDGPTGTEIPPSGQWWTDEYTDPVTATTWRHRELPSVPGRTRLEILEEETEVGHCYRRCDIPVLGGLDGVQLRRLRVAIDRAIRIVEDGEDQPTAEQLATNQRGGAR